MQHGEQSNASVVRLSRWRRTAGAVITALATATLATATGYAAEVTDVLDAFDHERNNPFDLSVRLRFRQDSRTGAIAREVRCVAADEAGSTLCPGGSRTVLARELTLSSSRQTMFIDARVGVFRDVELYASIPVVMSYQWSHKFAPGVTRANSTLYPPSEGQAVVGVPYESVDRSGLGDVELGFKWSPFNYYRDPSKPTWVFGVGWTLPSGEAMAATNSGVGLGLHQLELYSTISRRALGIIEPFANVHARLFFESDDSLFARTRQAATQKHVTPGSVIGARFGGELIPWEDTTADARVELEAGFSMDYHFRGRGYSDIWEALAHPSNPCLKAGDCANLSHSNSDPDPATGQAARTNGITDFEQFGRFAGWGGLHYQPVRYFQISATFQYSVDTPHFITYGEYGKDLDGKNGVQQANTQTPPKNEYSPVYLPNLDTPGNRLRLQDASTMSFMLAISGKL